LVTLLQRNLFVEHKFNLPLEKYIDCGLLIYKPNQNVFAGGSGCGCSAVVTFAHFLNRMRRRELKRILVVATGALLSPLSYQQKETIPCVANAVSIEM
jgi:Stage V sporulation protein AD (SpoVAD).